MKNKTFGLILMAISLIGVFSFAHAISVIKISHPSSGAILNIGNDYNLQWCTSYSLESLPAGYNNIYLYSESGAAIGLINRSTGATPCIYGDSVFSWKVGSFSVGGSNLTAGNYKIHVEYWSNNGLLIESGESEIFKITDAIAVIMPNGGENWHLGDSNLIIWTSYDSTITNYEAQLLSADKTQKWSIFGGMANNANNTTGAPWIVGNVQCVGPVGSCPVITPGLYYVRIYGHRTNDPEAFFPIYADSKTTFNILSSSAPTPSVNTIPTPAPTPCAIPSPAPGCTTQNINLNNCTYNTVCSTPTPTPTITSTPMPTPITSVPPAKTSLTEAQVQSILSVLQSFGADQATMNNVSNSLRGGNVSTQIPILTPTNTNSTPADVDTQTQSSVCLNLQNNMRYRSRDAETNSEVSGLQDFLQARGYLHSEPTGYFGLLTSQAIKNFQSANGISSTGFVGLLTRAKIKSLTCGQ